MTPRLRGIIVVGAVCFLIGWGVTWPFFSTWSPDFDVFVPPVAQTGDTVAFESYALILVDGYDNPQPAVEAVWLAHVPSDYSTIELLGLPPAQFRDQFSRGVNGVPLLSLQPFLRGRLAGTITFDREDVKELVERIGGAYVLGHKMNGSEMLTYIDSAEPGQPGDVLVRQAAVIQGLLAEMAVRGSQLDLARLMQTPSYCGVEQKELYELIQHYYPMRTDLIHVHPEMESTS